MIRLILILLASTVFCHAEVIHLPIADQKVLRDISYFHGIPTATNLPAPIFKICADVDGRLAEPGQNWEPTDVITNEKLPRKRLIWVETDGCYYVVHYESGGVGHGYHFLVAKLKNGKRKLNFVWHGVGEWTKDYSAFLVALQAGKVDDRLPYLP